MIGMASSLRVINFDRAGVLDDVKRQRDAIFEAQRVSQEVVASIVKFICERQQTADVSTRPNQS